MMAIESLFVAFFICIKEEALAEGAAKLFYFVRDQKVHLSDVVRKR